METQRHFFPNSPLGQSMKVPPKPPYVPPKPPAVPPKPLVPPPVPPKPPKH